jgi:hypothetical protein
MTTNSWQRTSSRRPHERRCPSKIKNSLCYETESMTESLAVLCTILKEILMLRCCPYANMTFTVPSVAHDAHHRAIRPWNTPTNYHYQNTASLSSLQLKRKLYSAKTALQRHIRHLHINVISSLWPLEVIYSQVHYTVHITQSTCSTDIENEKVCATSELPPLCLLSRNLL